MQIPLIYSRLYMHAIFATERQTLIHHRHFIDLNMFTALFIFFFKDIVFLFKGTFIIKIINA